MSSQSVGAFLIAAAVVVAFALGLEAKSAEPDKPVKVDDSKAPPMPALSIEREGDKFTALKVHAPDGKLLAIMWPDGRVDTVGEPTEAARAFWSAFSGYVQQCQALAAQAAQPPAKTEK